MKIQLGLKTDCIETRYSFPWLFDLLAEEGITHLQLGSFYELYVLDDSYFTDLRRELTIHGTWNSKVVPLGTDDWSTVLKFMDRGLQIAPMISDTPELEEGAAILASIHGRHAWHHKVIFKVTPELCG